MKSNKGMSGISTLIIFIALILVAAVAALVLLQTVGSLQSQALATGKESKEQIATNMQIKSVHGYVPETSYIVFFRVIVQLAPGSGKINLDKTYLTYTDGNTFKTGIDYNMTNSGENTVAGTRAAAGIDMNEASNVYIGAKNAANYYSLMWLGELAGYNDKTDIDPQDTVEVYYRTGQININTNVEFTISPPEGTPASTFFRTPSSFDTNFITLFP